MGEISKIQEIVQRLKKLDCPMLNNGDDAWVKEILFKPNFDRFHLMEWIFSKLGFSISKEDECQNAYEVKVKNLLVAISNLGLCSKDNTDLIQGVAPFKEQLALWETLIDILWRNALTCNKTDSGAFDTSKEAFTNSKSISELHVSQCNYVSKLCNSVNFKHLFKDKVQLFQPHLLKEAEDKNIFPHISIQTLDEIKAKVQRGSVAAADLASLKYTALEKDFSSTEIYDSLLPKSNTLDTLEEEIQTHLGDLRAHATNEFGCAYENLKLYLNISPDEKVDLGPPFQVAEQQLKDFLQLKDSLGSLKSSEQELKKLNKDLRNFQIPAEPLTDLLLRDCTALLKDEHS